MAEMYASSGVGTAGLTTGIIGTALGAVNSGMFNGIFGSRQDNVSRETFDLSLQLAASQRDNAILTSGLNTEKQIVETYKTLADKINGVRDELSSAIAAVNKKVDDNAASQAVINCSLGNSIGILQTQVEQLMSMTKLGIASTNIWTAG